MAPRRAARRSARSISRSGSQRLFATGLRNPNGLAWEPRTGALWTVVNERDELGSDLVPDYLAGGRRRVLRLAVQLLGAHVDERVRPQRPDLVAIARSRTTRWAARRGARPVRRAGNSLPPASPRACSSASTARGTAGRAAATPSCSCRSRRPAERAAVEVLGGFVDATAMRAGARGRRARRPRRAPRRRRRRRRGLAPDAAAPAPAGGEARGSPLDRDPSLPELDHAALRPLAPCARPRARLRNTLYVALGTLGLVVIAVAACEFLEWPFLRHPSSAS
jgi:hypothetical protein